MILEGGARSFDMAEIEGFSRSLDLEDSDGWAKIGVLLFVNIVPLPRAFSQDLQQRKHVPNQS